MFSIDIPEIQNTNFHLFNPHIFLGRPKHSPYVVKKAVLAITRAIRKDPECAEHFLGKLMGLLPKDKEDKRSEHSLLLTAVTALAEVAQNVPELLQKLRRTVPSLVYLLKGLVTGGFHPEYDINGQSDPHLQVKILQLLR